jgi:hypothetical protein
VNLGKAPEAGTIALIVVTALIGMLMGVFGKATAEWLLNLILRPIRIVKETIYKWVAPRNPLSISLRSYKKHVARSKLTRIENPVGPNLDVPLEHAFAPLKLISSTTEESVDLFSQAAASHRCIVLGGPGTGKTTLMKSLITSIIKGRAREEALADLIPVFVVLRNLAKKEHTVEQAIVAAFADYHFPGADRFVESALSQGKMLIILDGLDEVGASRDYVSEQIQHFCEHDEQREHLNRLIVTCRENSYRTKDLQSVIPEIVRVEPFANHHMRVFLEGWPAHKGRTAIKLYSLIQNDPQIRDICRNPLLLTILTGLYLDTENFELPTSRERFYKDAVEELLVNRPARRQMKQTFDADDKRQILERVALERLETVTPHEDPEEFTQDVIRQKAEEVLRQEKFDPRELIKELVDINGIIKPASEGSYTCAHRTIQEYFAAREARRTRETKDVVDHFGGRPEFIEVLYFYCGLMNNIPALASIVNTLISQGRWLEAGRCMLHMKEPPDKTLVERVAGELFKQVSPSIEYKAALEILSSLAQRRAPEFAPAREFFTLAVDHLAGTYGESGASALESALATSPEAAMKVIPGLLKQSSPRWKEAAVQLLRDIGTDEALDQLVQLLNDTDPFVRDKAGRILAGMLKSRQRDLRRRATLLPSRADATVWPLEKYFPGNLPITIAESLNDPADTSSEAINCAAHALRARASKAKEERAFLKQWQHVPRDLKLQRWRQHAGKLIVLSGLAVTVTFLLMLFVLQIWDYRTNQALIFTLTPMRVYGIDMQLLNQFQNQAKIITTDLEQRFPPNASGLARILPWNWSVEPVLPEGKDRVYETVNKWSGYESPDPYTLSSSAPELHDMIGLTSNDNIARLRDSIIAVHDHLPAMQNTSYVLIKPGIIRPFMFFLALIFYPFSVITVTKQRWLMKSVRISKTNRIEMSLTFKQIGNFNRSEFGITLLVLLSTTIISLMYLLPLGGISWLLLLPILSLFICSGVGYLLQKFNWPNNPLLPAAADIMSQPVMKETDQEAESDDFPSLLSA